MHDYTCKHKYIHTKYVCMYISMYAYSLLPIWLHLYWKNGQGGVQWKWEEIWYDNVIPFHNKNGTQSSALVATEKLRGKHGDIISQIIYLFPSKFLVFAKTLVCHVHPNSAIFGPGVGGALVLGPWNW